MLERACRAGAVLIAVAAVIDPAWVGARSVRPVVRVVEAAGTYADHGAQVREALAGSFDVRTVETPDTDAHVFVGRTAPADWPEGLTFVVTPPSSDLAPEIRSIEVPAEVGLEAANRVAARVAVPQASDVRTLAVTLSVDGLPADTRTLSVPAGTSDTSIDLAFAPARTGLARLRVTARLGDGPEVVADAVTTVSARTLRVLVYEARPSWGATFVRRALEDDPRFDVVVRSVTSRNVSVDAGAVPPAINSVDALDEFDGVVVATPEALSDREGAALDAYLRQREGVVVLLPSDTGGRVAARLTGIDEWSLERRPGLERVTTVTHEWTASEFLWPSRWPVGAEAVTSCLAPNRCAVWRLPVGGGRVIVSSALDGWRTRGAEVSTFGEFWRALVADEASATPRPIEIVLHSRLLEPGASVSADVAVLEPTPVPQAEWQNTTGTIEAVRLWPSGDGRYRAEFRAPRVPGRYRLVVASGSEGAPSVGRPFRAADEFVVVDAADMRRPIPERDALLDAFASSRGGAVVPMADLTTLPDRLTAAVATSPAETPIHPMHSPFWIVPFAGLLAVEWWSRRRRGMR